MNVNTKLWVATILGHTSYVVAVINALIPVLPLKYSLILGILGATLNHASSTYADIKSRSVLPAIKDAEALAGDVSSLGTAVGALLPAAGTAVTAHPGATVTLNITHAPALPVGAVPVTAANLNAAAGDVIDGQQAGVSAMQAIGAASPLADLGTTLTAEEEAARFRAATGHA